MSNDLPAGFVILFPLLFPLVFLGMWMGVCSLLALLARHPRALEQFPPGEDTVEQAFTFASGRGPRMVRFNGALYVGIGRKGLHIAPNGLFRPPWWWGVPCVPWRDVQVEGEEVSFGRRGVHFSIPAIGARWFIVGKAGVAILARKRAADQEG